MVFATTKHSFVIINYSNYILNVNLKPSNYGSCTQENPHFTSGGNPIGLGGSAVVAWTDKDTFGVTVKGCQNIKQHI